MNTSITFNDITFIDAQAMAIRHPETFEAPSKEELDQIKSGDSVKVCVDRERFWTQVISVDKEIIEARIDNDLIMDKLRYNDIIWFPRCCVFSIL